MFTKGENAGGRLKKGCEQVKTLLVLRLQSRGAELDNVCVCRDSFVKLALRGFICITLKIKNFKKWCNIKNMFFYSLTPRLACSFRVRFGLLVEKQVAPGVNTSLFVALTSFFSSCDRFSAWSRGNPGTSSVVRT